VVVVVAVAVAWEEWSWVDDRWVAGSAFLFCSFLLCVHISIGVDFLVCFGGCIIRAQAQVLSGMVRVE